VVSNILPFQIFEEYPTNWIINLAAQNMPIPKEIRLPKVVLNNSFEEVRHRSPIRKTANAIKNECTYMISRFTMLNELNSCFQLKYFGKIK
jgi:hypothetical protein